MKKSLLKINMILATFALFSCANDDQNNEQEATFENSVVILNTEATSKDNNDASEIIKIISFNEEFKLADQYNIEGNKYSDDGLFNDKKAGDGIYTLIQDEKNLVNMKNDKFNANPIHVGEGFKYFKELNEYLNISGLSKIGGKFGCSVRTVTCIETSWWNSCWPLSSPCTCVEFYDCSFEIEL